MRSFFAVFLGLIGWVGVNAQTTFNIVNHHQTMLGAGGGRAVIEQEDGYLMWSVQWAYDSTTSAMFATKFDLEGNYLWEKQYHRPGYNTDFGFRDPVVLVDGGFAAAVSFFTSSAPSETYLFRFNEEADTLWTNIFRIDTLPTGNHGTRNLIALSDGGFLHSGWCNVPGLGGCITRLDSEGDYLWEMVYPESQYIFSARSTSDGGFILGTSKLGFPNKGSIIKTDSMGQQQWRRNFGGHAHVSGSGVMPVDDGFLIPGSYEPTSTPLPNDLQSACLYKYDLNGNFLWRKDYDHGFWSTRSRIVPAMDGNYWMIGGMHLWPSTPTFVMKVNAEGDSLWQRRYRYYYTDWAENIGYGITPTSDGGLVMTGMLRQGSQDPQPQLQSNWLIKLDEHGCLVPGCHLIDDTGIADHVLGLNQYFSIWPNPVVSSGRLKVSFEPPPEFTASGKLRLVLLDALGRNVYDGPWPAPESLRAEVHLGGLSPGLYHLHLTDERSWLAGAKVVVE